MKKFFALLLVLTFMVSLTPIVSATGVVYVDDGTFATSISLSESDIELHRAAAISNEIYNDVLDSFARDTSLMANRCDNQRYPDYFGGAYINANGDLVIKLVNAAGANDLRQRSSRKMTEGNVYYETATVPYGKLMDTIYALCLSVEYFRDTYNIYIDMVYEDVHNSTVVVHIRELDGVKEDIVRNYFTEKYLMLKNSDGPQIPLVGGGDGIYVRGSGTVGCTLGFAARRSGQAGFVISGHAGAVGSSVSLLSGTNLGQVALNAYANDSSADAAWVPAASGVVANNRLYGNSGLIVGASSQVLAVGTPILMVTGYNNAIRYGTVTNANVGFTNTGGIFLVNQTLHNIPGVASGDSGSPVLTYNGYSSPLQADAYTLVGLITNSVGYSKYSHISSQLGVTVIAN